MSILKPTLVLNKEQPATQYQNLVSNVLPVSVRNEMLQGREHLVVPMVILTEGVHIGSQGPLLYTNEEMAKLPDIWNSKPIVVYHPEIEGKAVSACDPHILNTRSVGIMLNTKVSKGRLTSEAWLDKSLVEKVDERIAKAVNNKEVMELSTGLFVDNDGQAGEWQGEEYIGRATNFRADHLALLPDKIGACSVAKGAGFLRNEAQKHPEAWAGLKQLFRACGLGKLVGNELSFDSIRGQLSAALIDKLGIKDGYTNSVNPTPWPWIQDVYSNFFIYQYDGKLFRLGYTASDTGVTLGDGQPVEVKQVTEYRTVAGAIVGNQDQPKENDMNKTALVDAIIANKAAGWSEADRPDLLAMNEQQLSTIQKGTIQIAPAPAAPAPAAPAPVANTNPAPVTAPAPATPTVTANSNPTPVTMEQYIAAAPAPIREVLNSSIDTYNREKLALIDSITKNSRNVFTKEDLGNRPLGELRGLAALAAPVQQASPGYNYAGMAPTPVANADEGECLEMPSLTSAKK